MGGPTMEQPWALATASNTPAGMPISARDRVCAVIVIAFPDSGTEGLFNGGLRMGSLRLPLFEKGIDPVPGFTIVQGDRGHQAFRQKAAIRTGPSDPRQSLRNCEVAQRGICRNPLGQLDGFGQSL